MKCTLIPLAMLALIAAPPSQAASVEESLAALSREVQLLKGEIAVLKAMLKRDSLGNATFTVTGSRQDLVGANSSVSIGADSATAIGKSSTTQIGANSNLVVSGSVSQQISGNMGIAVARDILIQAGDQITLKTGDSTIVMKKDGSIAINGKVISVQASGDLVMKGAKILQN